MASCSALALRPARRGLAASVLAFAGLLAYVLVQMAQLAPQSAVETSFGATAAQAGQLRADDAAPVAAGPGQAPGTKKGVPFDGTPAVGALFITARGKLVRHFCTASVVHSPQRNLLITAAHCMTGKSLSRGRIEFAPGYNEGKFPYRLWPVTGVWVNSSWSRHRNPNDDFAFLEVHIRGKQIEKYTGAEKLLADQVPPEVVQVIGYPDAKRQPITCTATASAYNPVHSGLQQLVFDCDNFTDGTSGGPFLMKVSRKTGDGLVVGVIGGYEQGGDSPNVSYSARFLSNVRDLYKIATAHQS